MEVAELPDSDEEEAREEREENKLRKSEEQGGFNQTSLPNKLFSKLC